MIKYFMETMLVFTATVTATSSRIFLKDVLIKINVYILVTIFFLRNDNGFSFIRKEIFPKNDDSFNRIDNISSHNHC